MFQKYGGHFSEKKKRLRQRAQKLRACKNMGAIFLKKKSACGNVPRSSGLVKIWGPFFCRKKKRLRQRTHKLRACKNLPPWDSGRKTRFSNCPEDNRSKVSVKKSEIGFVVINFSRSIFPYMSNIYENG